VSPPSTQFLTEKSGALSKKITKLILLKKMEVSFVIIFDEIFEELLEKYRCSLYELLYNVTICVR